MAVDTNLRNAPHPELFKMDEPFDNILSTFSRDVKLSAKREISKVNDVALDKLLLIHERTFHLVEFLKIYYRLKVFGKLEESHQKILHNVRKLVENVTSGKLSDNLTHTIQEIKDLIKPEYWQPVVTHVSPRFIVFNSEFKSKVELTIEGKFYYAERSDCIPTFKFKGVEYSPKVRSESKLTFLIDVLPKEKNQYKFSYFSGELLIIWKKGKLAWEDSCYQVLFGSAPKYPGKLTAIIATNEKPTNTLKSRLSSFKQTDNKIPDDKKIDNLWKEERMSLTATQNFHIVSGTSVLQWVRKNGRIGHTLHSEDKTEIKYTCRGQQSDGVFQISCQEVKDLIDVRVENLSPLGWGGKVQVDVKKDEKILYVICEAFNGDTFKFFPNVDNSNSLIKVKTATSATSNTFSFEAMTVSDLNELGVKKVSKLVSKEALELYAVQAANSI